LSCLIYSPQSTLPSHTALIRSAQAKMSCIDIWRGAAIDSGGVWMLDAASGASLLLAAGEYARATLDRGYSGRRGGGHVVLVRCHCRPCPGGHGLMLPPRWRMSGLNWSRSTQPPAVVSRCPRLWGEATGRCLARA
jgi:hypothetical protein